MSALITITKNTRGKDSREIKFQGIGREVVRIVQRETNLDNTPITARDKEGHLITRPEEVTEITHEGVLSTVDEALELVNGNTQMLLDFFAVGYNKWAYSVEANKDELDAFVEGLDEAKAKARKSAIRSLAKTLEISQLEAAEIVSEAAAQ